MTITLPSEETRIVKEIRMLVPVEKGADGSRRRISLGVVLEPGTEDLQGDIMDPMDIELAAHDWMTQSQAAGAMHASVVKGAKVVESYLAPCDFEVETAEGPVTVLKGSWLLGVKWPPEEWEKIEKGEYTGYSVGGQGLRVPLEEAIQKDKGWVGGPNAGWRRRVPGEERSAFARVVPRDDGDPSQAGRFESTSAYGGTLSRAGREAKEGPNRFKNVAGQMLLPAELEAKMPALYSQENVDDPVIVAHYFNPAGQGDWYIYEGQREDDDFTMFGWGGVGDPEDYELGYSSLAEMAAVKGPLGIGIERDKFWTPAPLSQVKEGRRVTKRQLVELARDAFRAVIQKDKGWAPGPNAQWRRTEGAADSERQGKTEPAAGTGGRKVPGKFKGYTDYAVGYEIGTKEADRFTGEESDKELLEWWNEHVKEPDHPDTYDDENVKGFMYGVHSSLGGPDYVKPPEEMTAEELEAFNTPEAARARLQTRHPVWFEDKEWVESLGPLPSSAAPSSPQSVRTTMEDYLGQTIDYGGEEMTLAEVMAELRALPQWTQQRENAYIAGALHRKK
ncbi:MAG: DUF2958 domain-containing protein [Thermoleophilia bacterium]|nr:DUF2958 domain-containing protein [Thermoleophilia bacterium]